MLTSRVTSTSRGFALLGRGKGADRDVELQTVSEGEEWDWLKHRIGIGMARGAS